MVLWHNLCNNGNGLKLDLDPEQIKPGLSSGPVESGTEFCLDFTVPKSLEFSSK